MYHLLCINLAFLKKDWFCILVLFFFLFLKFTFFIANKNQSFLCEF